METDLQEADVRQAIVPELPLYECWFFNDSVTPIDFVAILLMEVFDMNAEQAKERVFYIHNHEKGVVGRWVRDIAEMKMMEANKVIIDSGYPLVIKMEREL